jgi:transcriptional regulator with XRE-family HTH domain
VAEPVSTLHLGLASVVRELRARHDVTQAELADEAGVNRNVVGRLETGALNPRLSTLQGIAAALGLEVWQLLRLAAERQPGRRRRRS